jgi:hypothetical protein
MVEPLGVRKPSVPEISTPSGTYRIHKRGNEITRLQRVIDGKATDITGKDKQAAIIANWQQIKPLVYGIA